VGKLTKSWPRANRQTVWSLGEGIRAIGGNRKDKGSAERKKGKTFMIWVELNLSREEYLDSENLSDRRG